MRRLLLILTIALAVSGWGAPSMQARPVTVIAPAHALIPDATSRPSFCTRFYGNDLFRCFCDEWLRYPLCKRWHWHRDYLAWREARP